MFISGSRAPKADATPRTTKSILVVGTSGAARDAAAALASESWSVTTVNAIPDSSSSTSHRVVVLDTDEVSQRPSNALKTLRTHQPKAAVVLLVTRDTPWASWTSYRGRPAGLCSKPVEGRALIAAVESALVYQELIEENRRLKRQLANAVSPNDWAGCTPESQRVRESIATSAFATGSIVFVGEKGCGRRLAAELVHRHSRTKSARFVPVDVTSVPRGGLAHLMSEFLVGPRSSSTDPDARVATVYLAELTALSPADQLTLKEIASKPLPFRLMASAHPSIESAVREGRFDEEILTTIFRTRIKIPALRERRGDIPTLVDHFLKRSCKRFGLQPLGIPPSAIEAYSDYDWPGNVSELSMVVERAVSIASAARLDTTILPEQFCIPPSLSAPEQGLLKDVSLRELIADIERRIIVQTLANVDGSQRRAAEELRLNPTTLHEKMKRYKILPDRHAAPTGQPYD